MSITGELIQDVNMVGVDPVDTISINSKPRPAKKRKNSDASSYLFYRKKRNRRGLSCSLPSGRSVPSAACPICRAVMRRSSIPKHLRNIHTPYGWQCNMCNNVATSAELAQEHCATIHQVPPEKVDEYIKVLRRTQPIGTRRPAKKREVKKPVVEKIKTYNCFDCSASFDAISSLFDHCEVHRYNERGEKLPFLVPPKRRMAARNRS